MTRELLIEVTHLFPTLFCARLFPLRGMFGRAFGIGVDDLVGGFDQIKVVFDHDNAANWSAIVSINFKRHYRK